MSRPACISGMRYVKLPGGGQMGDLLIPFIRPGFAADEALLVGLRACSTVRAAFRRARFGWEVLADWRRRGLDRLRPRARQVRDAASRVPLPPRRRLVVWLPVLSVLAAQVLRTADVLPDWAADCLEIATVATVLVAIGFIEVRTERTRRAWHAGRPGRALISGAESPAAVPALDVAERIGAMESRIADLIAGQESAARRLATMRATFIAAFSEAGVEPPAELLRNDGTARPHLSVIGGSGYSPAS